MIRHSFKLSYLVLVLLVVFSGCKPNDNLCASRFAEPRIANAGVYENVCGLDVSEDASQATLYVQVQLRRGKISWDLEDPQGKVLWSGSADASGPVDKSLRIQKPAAGRWNLKIQGDGAVGEYSAPWLVK